MSETRDEYLDRLKMKLKALVPSDQWKSSMVDALHSESLLLQADLESPARLDAPVSPSAARVGEDEPVTADWLRSIGYYEDDTQCFLIQEDEGGWLLAFLLDKEEPGGVVTDPGSVSWRGDDMLPTCKVATRGDVLRLMDALGITALRAGQGAGE